MSGEFRRISQLCGFEQKIRLLPVCVCVCVCLLAFILFGRDVTGVVDWAINVKLFK